MIVCLSIYARGGIYGKESFHKKIYRLIYRLTKLSVDGGDGKVN